MSDIIKFDAMDIQIYSFPVEQKEIGNGSNPLSPSFKQNGGSFFQKQKAHSNKLALTPTKQRIIRASSITNIVDVSEFKNTTNINNTPSTSANRFDTPTDNEKIRRKLEWDTPGKALEVSSQVHV